MRQVKNEWWRHPALLAAAGAGFLVAAIIGLYLSSGPGMDPDLREALRNLEGKRAEEAATAAELVGPFTPPPINPHQPPRLEALPLPDFPGAHAIWGSTGRDSRGHIWAGISASGVPIPSAHLVQFVPETDQVIDRGDVVSQLKKAGVYREGEGQMKIHSRIVQASDGRLYFASMDEQGEIEDGSRLPTWGSHLWRLNLKDYRWEHLLTVQEGLIAVAVGGDYVYSLGYFDHVLYQYHCMTGIVRSIHVGSVRGHISRNFLTDHRGHAYVPRLRKTANDVTASLVEFDTNLQEVAETPLRHYLHFPLVDCHGIVGVQPLRDRSLVFVTHTGYLYRIIPQEHEPAGVTGLGWFHPDREAYVPNLFTYDGEKQLLGLSMRVTQGDAHFGWLVFDLTDRIGLAAPMVWPTIPGPPISGVQLYGSTTRDNQGNFYLGGGCDSKGQVRPVLVRVRPPTP